MVPVAAAAFDLRRHLPHGCLLELRRRCRVVVATLADVHDVVHYNVGAEDPEAKAEAREGPLVEPRDHRVPPPRVLPTKSAHPIVQL